MSKPPRACPKANLRPHAEAVNRVWHAVAPADHTLSEALWPGYLGARTKDMKPGDDFVVRHETHNFLVRGYIIDVDADAGMIAFVTTELIDLTQVDIVAYDYVDCVVSRQPSGWAVMSGDTALKSGFASQEKAAEWLAEKRAGILAAGKVSD